MPPPTGGKRKRGDRTYSGDNYSRPSPHRPENLSLAQGQGQSPSSGRDYNDGRNRRGGRPSRGGRNATQTSSPIQSTSDNIPASTGSPAPQPESILPDTKVPTGPSDLDMATPGQDEIVPYSYTYLTDDLCESWEEQGRQNILQQASAASREGDELKTAALIQELLESALTERLDPFSAGSMVKEIIETVGPDTDSSSDEFDTTGINAAVTGAVALACENNPSLQLGRLRQFLIGTAIPQEFLRHEFDQELLLKLDMIRSTFARMGIRKQTNVLYRQANYNLMREESEGFAKLITELFTTSGCEQPSGTHVAQSIEKVKALIGAFDLDVGRSLDVVLDVFGAVLVKQFRFFVKFLSQSPWWPRRGSEASGISPSGLPLWAIPGHEEWHLTDQQKDSIAQLNESRDRDFWDLARKEGLRSFYKIGLPSAMEENLPLQNLTDDFSREWVEETGTIPPDGNRDAAQLLGFKLRFYSASPARDDNDTLPDHLIYLSALLIKIGFISLKDLYPHLWREDEEMNDLRKQKEKEMEERERASRPGAGAKNALLMAGALADDTISAIPSRLRDSSTRAGTPSKESEPEKPTTKDAPSTSADQKVALLKSLLAVGALPEALFILGRFPWVMNLYPDMPEYIHRILHHCLKSVYGTLQPLQDRSSLQQQKPFYETDVPGVAKGQVKIVQATERKILRWAQLDRADSSDGTHYRFYWDEWNDLIPVCQSVDDVFTLCETLLPLVGVKIGQDPALVLKLTRIGKHSLQIDDSEASRSRWLDLIKRILLPCLSLTKSNAGLINEVFELISYFPINTRYLMYLEWSTGRTSRNLDVKAANDLARAETKDILKRISKTNIRPMARSLAKIAYANPHIVITTALAQIEVYDSIAEVFVEGARYFTDLGYDVLTWALISSMARAGRSRTQDGGIFTSRWLIALAQFAGKIYRRYTLMRPGPLLQYVAQQLDQGNSTDLKMLEQLVSSMAGIATDTSYNDNQLQAMGGGPLLQSQTILQLLDQRHDAAVRASTRRLVKALQDTNLAGRFLLSMAQQRQACIFEESDVPLKAIGNVYDEIHRVMVQYLELLRSSLSTEEFAKAIPNVLDLLVEYEIRPEIAFTICRPLLSKQIIDHNRAQSDVAKIEDDQKPINGDIGMADQSIANLEEDGEAVEDEVIVPSAATATDADIVDSNFDIDQHDEVTPVPGDHWHPVLREIMDGLEKTLPQELLETIGTGFYVSFWQLSLYDIIIPGKSYEDELSRQHRKIASIKADRSDVSLSGVRKREAETKVVQQLIDNLLSENKEHLKALQESRARLQKEKDAWFAGKAKVAERLNTALLEYCFLPRIMASPLDAYFCFKCVKFLHATGTANFRTLSFLNILLKSSRLTSLIFMCSSKEADNLGRFLNEALKDLSRWHANKEMYEREAFGIKKQLPGFAKKVESGKPVALLDFESFRRVLYGWHGQIYNALQKCITSPEYMHVRNAISVLRSITGVFPHVNWHGTQLQKSVDKLRGSDKEDLKVASQALLGALHRREKIWISPQTFRQGQPDEEQSPPPAEKKEAAAESKVVADMRVTKSEEDGEVKDSKLSAAVEKTSTKAEAKPPSQPARSSADSGRLPSRPPTVNGSSTPRASREASTKERPASRQNLEASKPPSLPRKLSPPPRQSPSAATLPSRPDSGDVRNGHRDSPRIPPRPPVDSARPPQSRDSRSGYRGHEGPPTDDQDRYARRHERPEPISHSGRDDRGYGREREAERAHGPDRPRPSDRDRVPERGSERDRGPPPPPSRERDGRDRPSRGPTSRQAPVEGSPRPSSTAPTRPASSSESVPINPARAALINSPDASTPSMSIRGQAQDRPSRPPRGTSPKPDEDRRGPPRSDRDERHPSERRPDAPSSRLGPPAESPAGPAARNDYAGRYPRDSRGPHHQQPVDMQHGRLEQDPSQRPPPRNDRPAEAEVPSGPRGGRGTMQAPRGRGAPPINTQNVPPPAHDRPTPTGPSSRHSRNNSYQDNTSSAPPTPDTTGVHPSRLGRIEPSPTESARPPPPPPPPSQSSPPAGPRGNAPAHAPSGPSPTTRGPPAGPQSNDAGGRGSRSNRHPLATVNSTLSQAGQGPSGRGRGSMRPGSGSFNSHVPPGLPGPGPRPDGYAPPQQDLFGSQNPNGMPVGSRAPSRQEPGRDRRQDPEDRGDERRSTRGRELREREGRRDEREGKDERESLMRDERGRKDENAPASAATGPAGGHGDDRRGYNRGGPARDETGPPPPSRKHGRVEEGGAYSGGGGRGGGAPGGRVASDSKRVRRGP